jgi:hypothetical protein
VEEKIKAAYLADLDFFHSEAEEKPDIDCSVPITYLNIKLGEYTDAITAAEDGLKRSQFCTHLQVLLAEAYMHVGRKDEAREILFDAIVSDEDNYKAHKLLGVIFRSETDNENAIKYMRAAYMKAPEDTELLSWLEDIGGLSNAADNVAVVEDTSDDIFDYEADDPKFESQPLLTSAETALNELSREINSYKQQGKTVDHMISDHAAVAKQAAEMEEDAHQIAYSDDEIDKAPDMSNDEILKALSDANIAPGAAESRMSQIDDMDYSDILSAIEKETAEKETPQTDIEESAFPEETDAGALSAMLAQSAEEEGVQEESMQEQLSLAEILSGVGDESEDGEADEIAALAKAAEDFSEETEEAPAETAVEAIETEAEETIEAVEEEPIEEEPIEETAAAVEEAAVEEEAVEEATVEEEAVEETSVVEEAAAQEFKPPAYIPLEELPEIPLPPTDPTSPVEAAHETAEEEEKTVAEEEKAIEEEKAEEGLVSALNAMDISDDDLEEETPIRLENLSAMTEPEEAVLDALPKAIADIGEDDEAVALKSDLGSQKAEEADKIELHDKAPFIPTDLLDAVFKEGGVEIGEVFNENAEKIDAALREKKDTDEQS